MNTVNFISTNRGVTLFFGAKPVAVDSTHLYFNEIIEELKKGINASYEKLVELSDIPKAIQGLLFGDVTVTDGEIYYKNKPVHNTLTSKMIQMLREGWDISIWANFLNNVMKNPSEVAVNELYLFLEEAQMPLTPDGHFLAFKKVRDDYTSIHDGKTDNSIGTKPSMDRTKVDPDRHRTCSAGLHFCAHSYLDSFGGWGGNRVLVLKINPADVVAIPSDYNNAKGRAWTYEIVGEIDNPDSGPRDSRFDKSVDNSWDAPEDEIEIIDPELEPEIDEIALQEEMEAEYGSGSAGITKEDAKRSLGKDWRNVARNQNNDTELLFGDIYTAKEILAKVKEIGSVRGAGRALGIAKSTFGDWYKKAKEVATEAPIPQSSLLPEVSKMISDHLGVDQNSVKVNDNLYKDLGADSLDAVELVMAIEEEYGVEISDEKIDEFITVGDIIKFLEENVK